jgi:hypothetical protein
MQMSNMVVTEGVSLVTRLSGTPLTCMFVLPDTNAGRDPPTMGHGRARVELTTCELTCSDNIKGIRSR